MAISMCKTEYGIVRGFCRDDENITEFRSIPYARPPIGELRFAPPVEPEPWKGIKECIEWPPVAPQTFFDPLSELYPYGIPRCSEDCLYLNVYTAAESEDERRPVFVWYHDGGLTNGWSYDPRNDPTQFVKKGIVVVTVGHRLGELGYLALPQLTAEQGQSGNYGVMDTVMALEWVHRNIEAFGGDPDNVTIGGESGGTIKCAALAALPQVKGMFRRIISQSGLSWLYNPDTQDEAERFGLGYLKEAGIDPDISLDELRALGLDRIHIDNDPHDKPGNVTEDGLLFSGSFKESFMNNLQGVDLLNCVCSGDAVVGAAPGLLDANGRFATAEAFYAHFRSVLGGLFDKYDFERLVPVTDENAWETAVTLSSLGLAPNVRSNYCRSVMVDRIFGSKMAVTYPDSNVYTVRFSQVQPNRTDIPSLPDVAAPHGSDLWYSYESLKKKIPASRPWSEDDVHVAEWFNEYLANFIKSGNPNGEGLVEWKKSDESLSWLDLNSKPRIHTGLESRLDELLYEYSKKCYGI